MMYTFRELYHDGDNGYIIQCKECNNIQVAFGNVMLTFEQHDFAAFRTWLKELEKAQPAEPVASFMKSVVVPLQHESIQMLLSRKELLLLNEMLDAADTELQSQKLLQMFNA